MANRDDVDLPRGPRPVTAWLGSLTPGQRWTASLAVGLGVAILAFGLPGAGPLLGGPLAVAPPLRTAAGGQPGAEPAAAASAPGSPGRGAGRPTGPAASSPDVGGAVPVGPGAAPAPGAVGEPHVVALVTEPGPLEPRTDTAILARLAAGAPFPLEVVPVTSASACEQAAAAVVAIAASDLPPSLRACLVEARAPVIAHDAQGSAGPTVVSTRRGIGASLLETADRSLGDAGAVGIVAADALREAVEATLPELERRGVDVVATAFLGSFDRAPVGPVLAFASAEVATVVFAIAVDEQITFATALEAFRPSLRHVIADAADSIVNEVYPPTFDGAVAISPVAVPWADRAAVPDAPRAACLERWERSQTPPEVLDAEETVRVLAWCQLLDLAATAVDEGTVAGLLTREAPSTLTSPLGPLPPPASFGPVASAHLRWSASCRCWQPVEGFEVAP
jgi:hypothetical protein